MFSKYKNYYQILGVREDADYEEIKIAYRKLAVKYHPDINQGDREKEEKFKEITEAYNILSNPKLRAKYDLFLKYGAIFGEDPSAYMEDSLFDILIDTIMKIADGLGIKFYQRRRTIPKDIKREIEIDFIEACTGTKKEISFYQIRRCERCKGRGRIFTGPFVCKRCNGRGEIKLGLLSFKCPFCYGTGSDGEPCPECNGKGEVKKEVSYTLEILPSVEDGETKIIKGGGNSFKDDPEPGDLYVTIKVKEHPFFVRKGNNIYCKVAIPYTLAILGGEISVPTIYGKVKVKIVPGTQPNQVYRLKNQGVPFFDRRLKGDQYILIDVYIPKEPSIEERELLQRLAKFYSNYNVKIIKPDLKEIK